MRYVCWSRTLARARLILACLAGLLFTGDGVTHYNVAAFWKRVSTSVCPTGFALVPFNSTVGTHADFCVAKFEMKNVSGAATSQASGQPWENINRWEAR